MLVLNVGKPFSRGITASAPYVIEKRVSPVDFRGVVQYVQMTCGISSIHFPFASSNLFLSSFTMTLLTVSACPFPCGVGRNGIFILYTQIRTVFPESFAIKLKTIIRDECIGNPESSNNVLPDEPFDIYMMLARGSASTHLVK